MPAGRSSQERAGQKWLIISNGGQTERELLEKLKQAGSAPLLVSRGSSFNAADRDKISLDFDAEEDFIQLFKKIRDDSDALPTGVIYLQKRVMGQAG